jgi:hypothetical protein
MPLFLLVSANLSRDFSTGKPDSMAHESVATGMILSIEGKNPVTMKGSCGWQTPNQLCFGYRNSEVKLLSRKCAHRYVGVMRTPGTGKVPNFFFGARRDPTIIG